MFRYLTNHIISMLPTLAVVAVVGFMLVHLTPGDPAVFAAGPEASPAVVEQIRERMGLNRPLHVQFLAWVRNIIVEGNLGVSIQTGEPVSAILASRAEPTIALALASFVVALVIGVPLGFLGAVQRGRLGDRLIMAVATFGVSVPRFWLGLMLMLLFAVTWRWLPVGGYRPFSDGIFDALRHLVLPALALGLAEAALIARMTRTAMLEVMNEDYVRTARSKGLVEQRVLVKHALRTALIPILTVAGLSLANLLGGSVAIEVVFNYPGIGRGLMTAITRRDYPVVQAVVLLVGVIYMVVNLLIDLAYAGVDPRVRYN
ncbi:MAG: ABC transporter permease [Trueperaceae bacterium]